MIDRVLWLEQALGEDEPPPRPALAGRVHADVCVVGGGYTGMWTGLELRRHAPDVRVVLVEASSCGFGASGRNGGWAVGWHDKLDALLATFGVARGLWLAEQSSRSIGWLADRCRELDIDCRARRAGAFYAASASSQDDAWTPAVEACRAHGRGDRFHAVGSDEIRARTGARIGAGAIQTDTALLHPGLLARGLRRAAISAGVEIYEGTMMTRLIRGPRPAVQTPAGTVTCEHVVLAMGAWAARLHELRRAIVPLGTSMVATECVPDRLAELGWTGGEGVSDYCKLVHYGQATTDGRIAFGRGGGAIGVRGRVHPDHLLDPRWTGVVDRDLRDWWPGLRDVAITHRWSGPVDHAPGYFPFVGELDDSPSVHYAGGYSGDGVAQSTLLARILTSRVLDRRDDLRDCALTGGPRAYLPPEPGRSVGGRVIQSAVLRAETRERRGGAPAPPDRVLRRLAHAAVPAVLEPRLRARVSR